MIRRPPWLPLLGAILALPCSCGYRFGPGVEGAGAWTLEAETVAVPIFENHSFRQGLEFPLTDAFIHQLQLTTPARIVSRGDAEAVIHGAITAVRDRVRQENRRDQILASQVEVSAEVQVEFPASGRRVGPLRLVEVAEYIVFRGETRASATEEALRLLARDMVLALGSMRAQDGVLSAATGSH